MALLAAVGKKTTALFNEAKELAWDNNTFGEFLAEQSDRFTLWAVNMGLRAPGHGSLDYRVRDAEGLQDSFYQLLTNLNWALGEGR